MFEKSNLLLALATGSRGYTDKTHLRGLKTLIFRKSTEVDFPTGRYANICVVANSIRPIFFKHPLITFINISTQKYQLV